MIKLFNNIQKDSALKWILYEKKEHAWLVEFFMIWISLKERKKLNLIREKELDLTLKYLYPLLRDWKLKVRIKLKAIKKTRNIFLKWIWYKKLNNIYIQEVWEYLVLWREYKKEEAKKAIKDIRKKWLNLWNKDDRNDFEMFWVEFILPENEWEY